MRDTVINREAWAIVRIQHVPARRAQAGRVSSRGHRGIGEPQRPEAWLVEGVTAGAADWVTIATYSTKAAADVRLASFEP